MSCSVGWTCVTAVCLLVFSMVGAAQSAGDTASGTLQIAKASYSLKYAFAVMDADPFSDGEKEILVVLLSDVAVPAELRKSSNDWRMWVSEQAAAGAIHGVAATINPATGIWERGNLLTRKGMMFYSESVSGGAVANLHFEAAGPLGDRAAGKLSMKEPMSGMSDEDGPWRVAAEFQATVVKRGAVTGVLTGAEALASPQYKAIAAFLQACQKKDVAAISAAIDPKGRESLAQMFSASKDEALNMFSQMAAEALTYKLMKVTVRGDSAELEFKNPKPDSGESQTLRVVLAAGEWKVAQ